jgi:hemolysin III
MGVTHAHSRRPWSRGEEIANSFSHGIGLLAALIAVPLLLAEAVRRGDAQSVARASVFGITILLLYLTSTLFHALPDGRAKRVFEVLDNAAVFLLIAGTYTPLTLGLLRGAWGLSLFGVVWTLAAAGVVLIVVGDLRYPVISTSLCLGMGWLCLIALRPLARDHATARPAAGLGWRARIYGRARILGSAVAALPPSRLALVRSYRDGLPLPRNPLVCDLTQRTSGPIGEPRGQEGADL